MPSPDLQPAATPPLALYVHIPFCKAKCPYCGFYSLPITNQPVDALIHNLLAELDLYAAPEPIATIYLGGGSPACLPFNLLKHLISTLSHPAPTEFTLELNPGQLSTYGLSTLRQAGVNRLSIGAQSFRQEDLTLLGRPYKPQTIVDTVLTARQAGFDNLSLDLIYALPGSTLDHWQQTLERAISLCPTSISVYSLSYDPPSRFHQDLQAGRIRPLDESADRAQYDLACKLLSDNGLQQYELSNFALPGYRCQHNLAYWRNTPWLGLGPAGGSWYRGRRTVNIADVSTYIQSISRGEHAFAEVEAPSPLEIACETAVLNLRLIEGIEITSYCKYTGYDPRDLFADPLARLVGQGLLEVDDAHIRLTPAARFIADGVLAEFASL